jgi:hypothetical protein
MELSCSHREKNALSFVIWIEAHITVITGLIETVWSAGIPIQPALAIVSDLEDVATVSLSIRKTFL